MYEFIRLTWVMNFYLKLVDFRLGWNHKIVSVIHSVLNQSVKDELSLVFIS